MPTILNAGPYRIGWYMYDCQEPPHVHVVRDNQTVKIWLNSLTVHGQTNFRPKELRRIIKVISDNQTYLLAQWEVVCGG